MYQYYQQYFQLWEKIHVHKIKSSRVYIRLAKLILGKTELGSTLHSVFFFSFF